MHVFVTTFLYALVKAAVHRGEDPNALVEDALTKLTWPCARTIDAVSRAIGPGGSHELWLNSTTVIGKARSMAAHAFEKSGADVWVSVDDDAEIDADVAELLLRATHGPEPRIVGIPQLVAGPERRTNAMFVTARPEVSRVVGRARLVPVEFVGCNVIAVNRAALAVLVKRYPELHCPAQSLFAVFLEMVEGHLWYGEDVAFCRRARNAGVDVEILLDVESFHAGRVLPADWAEPFLTPAGAPAAKP